MKNYTGVRQMIADIVQSSMVTASVMEGVVKCEQPLKFGLTNDAKMTLTEKSVLVPSRLNGKLGEGDKVYLLSVSHGRQYYVLDKV